MSGLTAPHRGRTRVARASGRVGAGRPRRTRRTLPPVAAVLLALGLLAVLGPGLVHRAYAAAGTISGQVTDSASGAPIAGAVVATQPATMSTTTDSGGNYSLAVTSSGTYSVLFSATGYNSDYLSVTVPSGGAVTANRALAAVPAGWAQDLFSRPAQSGIGQASDGHTWTDDLAANPKSTVSVTAARQLSASTASSTYDAWMGIPYRDEAVSADIDMTSGGARLLGRVQQLNSWVVLAVNPSSDTLVLWVALNNQWTQLKSWAVAPNLAQNTWYHAKLGIVSQQVMGKIWTFGTPEPAWQISTAQTVLSGTGVGGLRSSGATGLFTNFAEAPITQVSGTVTDASTGQPIAGAAVSAGGATTTTDSTGAYVLGNLAAGTYTVTASANAYTSASQSATVSTGSSATASFALTPAAPPPPPSGNSTITGQITDRTSGSGIAGATVTTQPATGSVATDSAGSYTMSVPAGTYAVVASASGYNSDFATVATTAGATVTQGISLAGIPPLVAQDLFSRPDQTGIGTASDGHTWTDDHAVYPTGTEQIASRRLNVQTTSAATDYDAWMGIQYRDQEVTGDFDVTSGFGARLLARVQGSETWVVAAFNVSTDTVDLWSAVNNQWTQLASVPVPLSFNTWFHGKLDVVGQNVYAKVWAVGTGEPGWQATGSQAAVTGSGVGGLRVANSDVLWSSLTEAPITRIFGTVTDAASGQPIASAPVTLSGGASTTTDSSGSYAFNGLAAGSYTVTASPAGYGAGSATVSVSTGVSGTASFSLTSTAGGASAVSGTVTDSATGQPVTGASVVAQPGGASATTGTSGTYTLSVASGTYNVVVTASGYNGNFVTATAPAGGTATANVALVAVPPLAAEDLFSRPNQSGIGTASDGHAWTTDFVQGSSPVVQISGGQLSAQTTSTPYDAWMGIAYQDEEVTADVDMLTGGSRVMARVQGNGTWLLLAVNPGSGLTIWAVSAGSWTSLSSVSLALSQNTWYHVKLDVVGSAVRGKVWPTTAAEPGWQVSSTQTKVSGTGVAGLRSAGASALVRSFLEVPITQFSGTVTSAATGAPIAGAPVTLSNGSSTTTDSSGNFVFSGLAAGTYSVTVSPSGYTAQTRSFTVSVGVSTSATFAMT